MKIAIDAMGGDIGPKVTVDGAVSAAKRFGYSICLVGKSDLLTTELAKYDTSGLDISIKDASDIVNMDDIPSVALRQKRNSSINVAARVVKNGEADAMVSAGNTGAVMAIAKIFFGLSKGIDRPAIATVLPTSKGIALVLDVGANVDCKPKHLVQFAVMGNAYAQHVLYIPKPTIGILNIGSEESKGNELTRATYKLLKQTPFNFIGNVEGRDVFKGSVDVVIADGFVGNIALKVGEGVAEMVVGILRNEVKSSLIAKFGYVLMKGVFRNLKKRVDYSEYGGAPLLGLNKVCIICHGISDPFAIMNAIRVAAEFVAKKVNVKISEDLETVKQMIEEKQTIPGVTV